MKRIGVFALLACFLLTAGMAGAEMDVKPLGEVFFHWSYNLSAYDKDWDPRMTGAGHPGGIVPDYGVFDNDFNEFKTSRTYLGARAQITDALSAKLVLNSCWDGSNWNIYPEYAWGNYKIMDAVNLRAGILGTSWIKFLDWANDYRYVQKGAYEYWSQEAKTDLGVAILGKFPAGYGSYQAGIYNGEGVRAGEVNSGKAADLRVSVAPIQIVEATKMLSISLFTRFEKEDPDLETDLWQIGALLHWRWNINEDLRINVGFEYDYQTFWPWRDAEDEEIVNSYDMSFFADFKFFNAGVFVRYDYFDPNTENDEDAGIGYQDEQSIIIGGVSYDFHKYVAMAFSYQYYAYTMEVQDDEGDDVTLPADQFVLVNWKIKF